MKKSKSEKLNLGTLWETPEKIKSYIRHSMWSICLDIDFKGDFVIVDEASLWISHILKHNTTKRVHINRDC